MSWFDPYPNIPKSLSATMARVALVAREPRNFYGSGYGNVFLKT